MKKMGAPDMTKGLGIAFGATMKSFTDHAVVFATGMAMDALISSNPVTACLKSIKDVYDMGKNIYSSANTLFKLVRDVGAKRDTQKIKNDLTQSLRAKNSSNLKEMRQFSQVMRLP